MLEAIDAMGVCLLALVTAAIGCVMGFCALALIHDALKEPKEGPLPPYHPPF